ncbi:MAG: hypothetical protein PVSMB5_27900 [Ktedonobacteraceae bacterium]
MARTKGLRGYLEEGEEPVLALPAIWDNGTSSHSTACDVIVTDQRVIGFYYRSFPRERVFIDALRLAELSSVTWREKSYEPVFREILISDGKRKIYVRTPRQKSEELYRVLHTTHTTHTTHVTHTAIEDQPPQRDAGRSTGDAEPQHAGHSNTVYGRQEIKRAFDTSTLAILLLFVGGIILEIIGIILWVGTHSAQSGVPLFVAGFLAVLAAVLVRRQQRPGNS